MNSGNIRLLLLLMCLLLPNAASAEEIRHSIPVAGMVTMVDIGAKACIPCKMMAPIMEELEKEYKDKAAIIFIDVWENPGAGDSFGIKLIPTQIFYDAKGIETFRHEGFLEKAAIIAELSKLGVN